KVLVCLISCLWSPVVISVEGSDRIKTAGQVFYNQWLRRVIRFGDPYCEIKEHRCENEEDKA
ncbi:hypothetical protein GIB67_024390, partial [Kingdonia uniflora]